MTEGRPRGGGPSWRSQAHQDVPEERAFLACQCGVTMELQWPRGRDSVRCFGCRSRFERPDHFPEPPRFAWKPPTEEATAQAPPRLLTPALVLLALALALALLLLPLGG